MFRARALAVLATAALTLAPALPAQAAFIVKATDNNTFRPGTASVARDTKVTWKNTSNVSHTVTATSNNWTKNVVIAPGETTSRTFKRNGTYRYKCRFHSGMTGKVVVG
jgi:plastocyanin